MEKIGFKAAKAKVLQCLKSGAFQFEVRYSIDVKNKLATGDLSADQLVNIIKKSTGCSSSFKRASQV